MKRRYVVKIEDTILPQNYSFDELINKGLLDNVDENIKVKLEGDSVWIIARNYPFSEVEGSQEDETNMVKPRQRVSTSSFAPFVNQQRSPDIRHTRLSECSQNIRVQGICPSEIHSQPTSPTILNTWNWGAFVLSWIWGVCNGIYWPLIMIVCNFIPYIGVFCSLGICVYLGLKGNDIAWAKAEQNGISIYSFENTQRIWNGVGLILFAVSFLMAILYVLFIML